jgi:hypothetical protein
MLRSVLSVLAGIAILTAASFAIEAVVNPLLLRAFPQALPSPAALSSNQWVRLLTFAYGLTCVAAGGYVAARIARRLPIQHAAGMGILQEANHASQMQWITIAMLSMPAALTGGFLYKRKKLNEELEKAPAST